MIFFILYFVFVFWYFILYLNNYPECLILCFATYQLFFGIRLIRLIFIIDKINLFLVACKYMKDINQRLMKKTYENVS